MRVLRFDAGEVWDDPNARWGDPSYVLEPGDNGYINPNPTTDNPQPTYRMNNNEIPRAEKSVLGLAEDCADGCHELGTELELSTVTETSLRARLLVVQGTRPNVTPVVIGTIKAFKLADSVLKEANAERRTTDVEVRTFLTDARTNLLRFLGREPSAQWALAGYGTAQGNSNAVPGSMDGRFYTLGLLRGYLADHPEYEQAAGTQAAEVTAAKADALYEEMSSARSAANTASTAQKQAMAARLAAVNEIRQDLILLVRELYRKLGADDPRWETFGLNIPNNPRAPEAATDLALSEAGIGQILAEWERGTRSDDDRVLIQILGVDADFREYSKSGGDGEQVIKGLPSGATVRVKIIALNGSLEAADGPVGEISVP